MADPLKQYAGLLKAAEQAQRMISPLQGLSETIARSSAFLATHRSGIAEAVLEMQRKQELLKPALGIERMLAQMQATQEMASRLSERFHVSLQGLDEQTRTWQQMVQPAIMNLEKSQAVLRHAAGLADSFVAWESSATRLASRLNDIGLIAQKAHLSARLFAPSGVFTAFARDTIARIENARSDQVAWALDTSLRLAEEQLISTTETLDAVVAPPEDEEEVSELRELQSPYIQQEELVGTAETLEEEDTHSLIEASPAANAVDLSRNLLNSIATCNEAGKVTGAEEIFKPTTKLLEVYVDMPWLLPLEKKSFAEFVDCLYFLFYEGAGKDNLRFLKKHGGPIEDDDFDFILCIKHLRNKWTRHDADHGKEGAIKKSWSELAAKFQWLGLTHIPVTSDDFRLLHVNLLAKANEFAQKILRGLVRE